MINKIKDMLKGNGKIAETQAWREFEAGRVYNSQLGAYRDLDQCNRFYEGDHWRGLESSGHPTPVFNLIKRVIDFKVSAIASEPITMRYTSWSEEENDFIKTLNGHTKNKWEWLKMDSHLRQSTHTAAVEGVAVSYMYWDDDMVAGKSDGYEPSVSDDGEPLYGLDGTPQTKRVPIEGDYCIDHIPITQLFLSEPQDSRINKNQKPNQEYVLLTGRESVDKLIREAEANGGTPKLIGPDEDITYSAGDHAKYELETARKATYIIKMFYNPDTKTVWSSKYTRSAVIVKPYDTKLTLYPVALMPWTPRKSTYIGRSEIKEMIPNNVVINKIHAICARWTIDSAFGRVIYDATRIRNWSNGVGKAIKMDGPVNDAVQQVMPAQINPIVVQLFDRTIDRTFEVMGVNDVILGNVRPENAAAIIAIQQTSSVPLENVKANLYQYVEDIALIQKDFIRTRYTVPREVKYENNDKKESGILDIEEMPDDVRVKVDVGASSHWSQIASMETSSNLLQAGYLTLPQFLNRAHEGYVPKRDQLMEEIKTDPPPAMVNALMQTEQLKMQMQQMQNPQQPPPPGTPPQGEPGAPPPGAQPPQGVPPMPTGEMPEDMSPPQQLSQIDQVTEYFQSLPLNLQERIKALPQEQQAQALIELVSQQGGNVV